MQTDFTEDQHQFRTVVSRFLQDKSTPSDVRRLMDTDAGYDQAVWQQLCQEVGLAGTHIPEIYGGFGFGSVELGIVCEEMGRYLYGGPFFASSVMAASALMAGGHEQAKHQWLPEIASGTRILTLVLDNLDSTHDLGRALCVDDNGCLSGSASIVVDAGSADYFVVIASHDGRLNLYGATAASAGLTIAPRESLDATRKIGSVSFDAVPVAQLGVMTPEAIDQCWNQINVALSHEMLGGAQHLFDTTLDYTSVRVQFGRPIGSFQALKHRCADLLMSLEFARAAVHHAGFVDAAGSDNYSASMAKSMMADTYMEAARTAIQLRGGIGFTWEEDTHLWFKRAKSSEVFMGSPNVHRERMMQAMLTETNQALAV